jgi:uncharacterized membrane protein YeaQ/YmgE (transglycosylase-associated protein family)
MDMGILSWIVLGLVAGWLASQFVRGGYGLIGHIVLGIVGAIVGGFISGAMLGRDMVAGFNLESVVVAFLAAVALIAISRLVSGRRGALAR